MNKILLMDFSNLAYATYYAMLGFENDFDDENEKIRYWKAMMLNSIKKNKMKHRPDEYVICIDSISWRKKAFKFYKAKREEMKKESDIDFQFFFEKMNEFIDDLKKYFPYKVIKVNGAEADDIIAVLALELKNKFKKVIIASNDKDFSQLVKDNIHLWNIKKEKFIHIDDNKEFLIQHILSGDSSDGIPNVRSDDDTFITDGKRQKPCGPKMIGQILEQGLEEWFEAQWVKEIKLDEKKNGTGAYQELKNKSNQLKRNFKRNKKLIELSQQTIPKKLWEVVIHQYNKNKAIGNYSTVMQYFTKQRMRQQLSDISFYI